MAKSKALMDSGMEATAEVEVAPARWRSCAAGIKVFHWNKIGNGGS
jgi:hypothetical protein